MHDLDEVVTKYNDPERGRMPGGGLPREPSGVITVGRFAGKVSVRYATGPTTWKSKYQPIASWACPPLRRLGPDAPQNKWPTVLTSGLRATHGERLWPDGDCGVP